METRIELNRVEGGCTFFNLVEEIFKKNGIKTVKLYKNWKNNKTVFEISKDERYVIGESSFIFNYDGMLELEKFNGAVREIREDNNIRSQYASHAIGYIDQMHIGAER